VFPSDPSKDQPGRELLHVNGGPQPPRGPLAAAAAGKDPAGARPAALSAAPDAMALLRALGRRWVLALTLAAVAGPALAAATWYAMPHVMPPKHTARTTVHVASRQQPIAPGTPVDSRGDFTTYQRTQIAMIKSRLVLNAALRDPKVADLDLARRGDAIEWLEKEIRADYSVAPEVLTISITGDDPDELIVLIDAVRNAYLKEIVNRELTEVNSRLEKLKLFYSAKDEALKRKRQTLKGLAQSVGYPDAQALARTQEYVVERLTTARHKLQAKRDELRDLLVEDAAQRGKEEALKKLPVPDALVEEEVRKDKPYEQHRLDLAKLEEDLEKVRRLATRADDPPLRRATAAVETAKEALAARAEKLRPLIRQQFREKAEQDLQLKAAQRQERTAVLAEQEKQLKKEVDELEEEADRVKKGAAEIASLRDEIAREEDAAKALGTQMQALTMELQADPRVTVLEGATASQKADRRLPAAAGAGAAAVLLVLAGIAWREFQARRVCRIQDVVEGLGITLVGAVPDLPGRAKGRAGQAGGRKGYWWSLFTESVDGIRTVLVRVARTESVRSVMVTSALASEGKTSVSSHLAISLARAGFRTVLVDGDLRQPSVHRVFDVDVGPGLNEVLRGESDLDAVVRETRVRGLAVVPGGHWDGSTTQALAQGGVGAVLEHLKGRYEFVVVDSSPALPVVDPLLIGQHVDAVILSVLRDVSRLPQVYEAYRKVSGYGIRVLGAVVSGTRDGVYQTHYQGVGGPAAKQPLAGEGVRS
jgi:polysaccharide biosynthesis transport protein